MERFVFVNEDVEVIWTENNGRNATLVFHEMAEYLDNHSGYVQVFEYLPNENKYSTEAFAEYGKRPSPLYIPANNKKGYKTVDEYGKQVTALLKAICSGAVVLG